jgi:LPXTG-motif cell wall-anchored protein
VVLCACPHYYGGTAAQPQSPANPQPSGNTPAGGAAQTPVSLPNTGGETTLAWLGGALALAALGAGAALRRRAR